MPVCRCGFRSWRKLRKALGLTQVQMGELMEISDRAVRHHEQRGLKHQCPEEPSLTLVQAWLMDEVLRRRVEQAGVRLPRRLR